jgi:cyclin-dependent kinase 12/13
LKSCLVVKMGCINSKTSAVDDSKEGLTKDLASSSKRNFARNVSRSDTKKRVDGVLEKDKLLDGIGSMKVSLIEKESDNGSVGLYDDHNEKKTRKMEKPELAVVVDNPSLGGRVPKALEGEQVAAGWPTWLSSVAGEAINGWLPRSASTFEKYDKVSKLTTCLLCLWLHFL